MDKKTAYLAFDIFPSAKGAATHIFHFSSALFDRFNGGYLFVLGNEKLPVYQNEDNIEIFRFLAQEPNYLLRSQSFTDWVLQKLENLHSVELIHFRDIWGGLAALNLSKKRKTVFEVNSLTSIELPYKYKLSKLTLEKIRDLELFCLNGADQIIVPSQVIKNKIVSLGVNSEKITLITNGAEIVTKNEKLFNMPKKYLLYFGALQAWQGIDILLRAFSGLQDFEELQLVIISSNPEKQAKPYLKLAEKLEISKNILWLFQLPKEQLNSWISNAYLTIAPLIETARNIEQGCSPLKIFESLAASTTVVASDLEVVREIITNNETGKLFRPGRYAELSRAIRFLLDFPEENDRLAKNGYQLILDNFLWEKKIQQLLGVYKKIMYI